MVCKMCENAHTNPDLRDVDDMRYTCIGDFGDGHRAFFCTGGDVPTVITFEKTLGGSGCYLFGRYYPKFCPNCGRRLTENEKKDRT